MSQIFNSIFGMSVTASVLILAVILFRLIFKKVPKWICCVAWAMVAVRLVMPFSIESKLSLAPDIEKISSSAQASTAYITTHSAGEAHSSINIFALIWLIGVLVMAVYMLFSYLTIRLKVRESIKEKDNIWICDHITSPFILGVIKPKIYIFSDMKRRESKYVIAHEQAHIKRLDYIWKPLGFLILCLHWFNPFCWVAYWLFNKDIELACDEKVIKNYGIKNKKAYSKALLNCSSPRKILAVCPLAFGENNVKKRIKSVLSYKKPTVYIITTAVIACVFIGVLFMTSPITVEAKVISQSVQPIITEIQATTAPATEVVTTEPVPTEVVTTIPPTTQPVTEEETEAEEVYQEDDNYYQEEYYYEDTYNEESYDEDSYSDNSQEDEDTVDKRKVAIQEFDTDRMLEDNLKIGEAYREIREQIERNERVVIDSSPKDIIVKWDIGPDDLN